jgi:hypothetical protein
LIKTLLQQKKLSFKQGLHVNKKALTLVFVTMLLFSVLIGVQFINKAKAETLGPLEEWLGEHPSGNLIKIITPQNTTYDSSSILLNFTVESNNYIYDVGYSLDGGDIERVNNLTKISEEPAPNLYLPPSVRVTYLGNLLLSNFIERKPFNNCLPRISISRNQ